MSLKLKNIPFGSLPYDNEASATKMMVKLFEFNPYLPFFPKISDDENIIFRTIENLPGIEKENGEYVLNLASPSISAETVKMDAAYNNPTDEAIEPYGFSSFYLEKFYAVVKRIQPPEVVINFLGPYTLSQTLRSKEQTQLLTDKFHRKYIVQAITLKAIRLIREIKKLSPKTTPIIILEEDRLNEVGIVTKINEDVTREIIINIFSKIIAALHSEGALVCVQCFKKCDWQIPIDAGVDIISFGAYTNPANLNIIGEKIDKFLKDGGYINWAIVPAISESLVKTLSPDSLLSRLHVTMQGLIDSGVSRKNIFKQSTVSIQGDVYKLPLIFVERMLMLSVQLGKRAFK